MSVSKSASNINFHKTYQLILQGIKANLVRFTKDPHDSGTVCTIGNNWIYFGEKTAAETAPEQYLATVGPVCAAEKITEALLDIQTFDDPQYLDCIRYLEEHLQPVSSHWAEIRCNYFDDTDGFWRVDAWLTDDDNEEGKVIAYIDDLTGRVLYNDTLARIDTHAQEIIKDKQNEILNKQVLITRNKDNHPQLIIKTKKGTLIAEAESKDDTGFDSIFTGFQNKENHYIDLTAVRAGKNMILYAWNEPGNEDPTFRSSIEWDDLLTHME